MAQADEVFVAVGLLVQSVIPAITMTSKGYKTIVEIYGNAYETALPE